MSLPRPATVLTVLDSGAAPAGSQPTALVVGGGHAGRALAASLGDDYRVTFLSRRPRVVERAESDGLTTRRFENLDATSLAAVDADRVALAVVATGNDGVNLLAGRLLRGKFGVDDVVVRVNDPEKLDSLENLDVIPVNLPDLLASEVTARLEAAADEAAEG